MACLIPAILIYILLNKPDYKLMDAARGVVVPVAGLIGDAATWPFRAGTRLIQNIRDLSQIYAENEELRARLDSALRDKNTCDYLIAENERLEKILDAARQIPQKTILANVVHDLSALHHSNIILDKGADAGVRPGNVAVSTDGFMIGIVTDVYGENSRVRALSDSKSNIPVRAAGTDVYGFLRGDARGGAVFEFFSDPEFVPGPGVKLLSSGIKGNLPNGINIGTVGSVSKTKAASVELGAAGASRAEVMILSFDAGDKYK